MQWRSVVVERRGREINFTDCRSRQAKEKTKITLGFESKISGYIASHLTGDEAIKTIQKQIETLPNLENDEFPFLPKDIFNISKPINKEANRVQISYRSTMIHFAMSVKQLENDLEIWLKKFESFFKEIPGAYEANVDVSLSPYTGGYRNDNLNFNWKKVEITKSSQRWIFKGDPSKLDEIWNPINQTFFNFSEEFKNKLIENLQWLSEQKGKRVLIEDKLTTNRGNYNRHFARLNNYDFELINFGVRTSGAMGMIEGKNIWFEFKTDSIRRIERDKNQLTMELKIDLNTTRLIKIEIKKKQAENRVGKGDQK